MKLLFEVLITSCAVGLISLGGNFVQQDEEVDEKIVLVDQDGQKVTAKKFKVITQGAQDGGDIDVDIKAEDGKIIIVDENGKKREIDVSGAQNIIVNKSVQTVTKDGENQKQVSGKAIIIGPDGERQEIILGDGGGNVDLFVPKFDELGIQGVFEMMPKWQGKIEGNFGPGNFVFGANTNVGKYMIGVNCSPVSDQLRAHLELGDGVGLVVTAVTDAESPAAQAGIKEHDVLVYADQEDLKTIQNLVDAVQLAGKEKRELTVTLVRGGKEKSVEVSPVERKGMGVRVLEGFPGANEFRFEKIGPGFVFEDDKMGAEKIMERFKELDAKMRQQLEDMKGLEEQLRESLKKRAKDN